MMYNRPNFYNEHKLDNYIAMEAQNYELTWFEANEIHNIEFGSELASIHSTNKSDLGWNIDTYISITWILCMDWFNR